jgi:hypothetical protein
MRKMEPLGKELIALLSQFKAEVATAVQRAALAAIADAYGEDPPRIPKTRTPRRRATPTRLARRGVSDMDAVKGRLLAAIGSEPGQRFEQLRTRLKLERRELVLPLRKLVAERKVKTKGVKRATAYYPTGRMTSRTRASKSKRPR